MQILTLRKVCTDNCEYDKSKCWIIDEPYTPQDLIKFVNDCIQDKFTSHKHDCVITCHWDIEIV